MEQEESKVNFCVTKITQTHRDRRAPLEIAWSERLPRAGSARAGCPGLCLVQCVETSQTLWETYASVQPPSH